MANWTNWFIIIENCDPTRAVMSASEFESEFESKVVRDPGVDVAGMAWMSLEEWTTVW